MSHLFCRHLGEIPNRKKVPERFFLFGTYIHTYIYKSFKVVRDIFCRSSREKEFLSANATFSTSSGPAIGKQR